MTSAGAIFVGPYSPVSLGDYMAGSNHVLPTGGCSHYSSGLGVHSFLRPVQVIEYGADALAELLAGGAAEGHDQHPLERHPLLGDEAGDQRADGPGLAGAGAGLDQARAVQREGQGIEELAHDASSPACGVTVM